MITMKPSYFGHIMRGQGSLEETIICGKIEEKRKTKHEMD